MSEPVPPVSVGRSIVAALLCSWALAGFVTLIVYVLVWQHAPVNDGLSATWEDLLPYIAIGFVAQMIDGSLGAGFGIITNIAIISWGGLSPVVAATSIRTVEGFVCGAAAVSHAWLRNVDWRIFSLLVTPGIIGSVAGAYVASRVNITFVRPAVYLYLMAMAGLVLWRLYRRTLRPKRSEEIGILGLGGGFFDMAGGGWGPIVGSNLLLQGVEARIVVGTVAATEFFVTIAISVLLIGLLGAMAFTVSAIGLLIGGVAAAPLAAFATKQFAPRTLTFLMAGLVVALGAGGLVRYFFL